MKLFKVLTLFTASVLGSSCFYVILTFLASLFSSPSLYFLSCVQGLSAAMFALKVIVLFDSRSAGPS